MYIYISLSLCVYMFCNISSEECQPRGSEALLWLFNWEGTRVPLKYQRMGKVYPIGILPYQNRIPLVYPTCWRSTPHPLTDGPMGFRMPPAGPLDIPQAGPGRAKIPLETARGTWRVFFCHKISGPETYMEYA